MRSQHLLATSIAAALVWGWPGVTLADPAVLKERLHNGLTVLVRENPAAPLVAVSLLVRVGRFALDRRTSARLAWYQAFFESAGIGYHFADQHVQAVGVVAAVDVQRVANAYLSAPSVVRLEPAAR